MNNFWDYKVWQFVSLISAVLGSLLLANCLKRKIKFLKYSLIPTSVLGGIMILIITSVYKAFTGVRLFDTAFFGGNGTDTLETITYHCLALGFIAQTFKSKRKKFARERAVEIFNTGTTTVATYLMQGVLGMGITIFFASFVTGLIPGAGALLPFGYGQGTGQALNFGGIYEESYGFAGGRNFGLTVAALGFISAAIGGVIRLNVLKAKGKIEIKDNDNVDTVTMSDIQSPGEIPMNGGLDKITMQFCFIFITYFAAYLIIMGLSKLVPGLQAVLYGFNFLFGVLCATIVKWVISLLKQAKFMKRDYINPFFMDRISGFFFDLMIVAGVAAIRIELLRDYWYVVLIMGVIGAVTTYYYNLFVAKKLFPSYENEQFLVMYGMLTGTASTGVILLREADPDFKTPACENLVYQNFPAMIMGFPLMLIGNLAPKDHWLAFWILLAAFIALNIVLFRRQIFKRAH